MILVADSGSTKTDWKYSDKEHTVAFSTPGINPFYLDAAQMTALLREHVSGDMQQKKIDRLFFYGAGCSTPLKKEEVKQALLTVFQAENVEVESDMLGAARAGFGLQEGIACILGTGSNTCFYNGHMITENLPSYGYLFGDYGSGAHIGKSLVQAYFKGELPAEVKRLFEGEGHTREPILEQVYKKAFPNRFLAGYSRFVKEHIGHPYLYELVKKCFHEFFTTQVEKYDRCRDVQVNLVGSVAFHYEPILVHVARERGITIGKVMQTPVHALHTYHQTSLKPGRP